MATPFGPKATTVPEAQAGTPPPVNTKDKCGDKLSMTVPEAQGDNPPLDETKCTETAPDVQASNPPPAKMKGKDDDKLSETVPKAQGDKPPLEETKGSDDEKLSTKNLDLLASVIPHQAADAPQKPAFSEYSMPLQPPSQGHKSGITAQNNISKISSSEWAKDFQREGVDPRPVYPSVFTDPHRYNMGPYAKAQAVGPYSKVQAEPMAAQHARVSSSSSKGSNSSMNNMEELLKLERSFQAGLHSDGALGSMFGGDAEVMARMKGQDFNRLKSDELFRIMSEEFRLRSTDSFKNFIDQNHVAAPSNGMPPLPRLPPIPQHFSVPAPGNPAQLANSPPSMISSAQDKPKTKRRKKSRKRELDESKAVELTENDVLLGRGSLTNRHPGNKRFREKALEFRPWYESSSKEEKQRIADLLVDSIKSQGHRFLGKGEDGLWHEVIGNGAHYKASQALRERLKK